MSNVSTIASERTRQCGCRSNKRAMKWTTAGGMLAAAGVCAACCLLPFALLSVGVAGAWVTTLDALNPYKWVFIGLTVVLLGYGFYAAYWRPRQICEAGAACELRGTERSVRIGLWIATILAVSGIVFEQVEPYLV